LDGNSVLHRAYYALPDWRNRSGEATAGVYGFLSMLIKALEELKPSHLAVVFDHPSPTFRHTMYVGYQTNREKERQISEDIWGQVEKLQLVFSKMEVPTFQMSGFEADDLIGTIATQASKDHEVIIITGDRDMMQLVNDKVKLFMPLKGVTDMVIVDKNKVKERLNVWPNQVIDYKALVGDSSDNYPGVAGIGPKTACDLLAQYDTFENVYEHLPKISPATVKKLTAGYESGELSKRLATIKVDVPLTFDINTCQTPSSEKMTDVLKELGHKSLIKRMGGEVEATNQPGLFD
jgi:DNA polymerase-1